MAWQMWVVSQGNLCVPKEKEKQNPIFKEMMLVKSSMLKKLSPKEFQSFYYFNVILLIWKKKSKLFSYFLPKKLEHFGGFFLKNKIK
jgi:hypothetical protein